MHEENFLSSWVECTEEGRKKRNTEAKEEESKSGKREVVREDEKTVIKRRCVNPLSCDVFEKFSPRDELESSGNSWVDVCGGSCGFSVCLPLGSPGVLVVTVVLVSTLSTGVLGEGVLSGSDCELVESQPSSL